MNRRFYRKSNDKIIGGVCSGLADYIGMNTGIIRLLALVGIAASGFFPGLLLYILCVIIVPQDNRAYHDPRNEDPGYSNFHAEESHYSPDREYHESQASGSSRVMLGILLIAVGVFLLLRLFFGWIHWRYIFASLLVLGGLYILFSGKK